MQVTQEHRQRMESIIEEMQSSGVKCLRDFQCYQSSLEKLCKIKGVGAFDNVECYSEEARCCGLSFAVDSKRFCKCPLRKYISQNFRR
jgi:hypothetical protein